MDTEYYYENHRISELIFIVFNMLMDKDGGTWTNCIVDEVEFTLNYYGHQN